MPQTLIQAPAKSSKNKSGKQNKRVRSDFARKRTKAAGLEAAKTAEKEREGEEEKVINTCKVAARVRGSQGKKRTTAAADSTARLIQGADF